MIRNGGGLLDEKGFEEKVLEEKGLEDIPMATGEGILWQQGKGCYRDRRWLLWRLSSSRSLMRLSLDSFLYFAKSNSSLTLVDLIFLLILSVHVTLILSYPLIFTFTLTRSLSFYQMHWLFL